jgi:oligopeptide transport system substrate-binding protein
MKTRQVARGSAFCILMFCFLGACDTARSPTAVPTTGSVLRRGNGPEPDSLDPQLARTDSAGQILRDLYEGLLVLDRSGAPAPGVAARWEVNADASRYVFHLRQDARWSNGEAVVAEDFVRSWRRLVRPATAAPYADELLILRGATDVLAGRAAPDRLGVTASDAHTLVVELERPAPYFPALVAHWSLLPTDQGEAPRRAGETISNGAYVLSAWIPGSEVRAERNRYYWNAAATHIKTIRYLHIPDANDEYRRFRADEIDTTYSVPTEYLDRPAVASEGPLHRVPQLGLYYYAFNLDRPPFKDARALRQALAMAIDRERLVTHATGLGELPAFGWVPPGFPLYVPQRFAWSGLSPDARIATARRLYAEAGYTRAKPLRIALRIPTGAVHERVAVAIASMWHDVLGVEVELSAEEFKTLLVRIERGEATLFWSSWVADYDDPWTFASLVRSGAGTNLARYRNPSYDAILDAASRTPDPASRSRLLERAERTLLEDAAVIPLYFYVNKHLISPRVHGWTDNGLNVTYSKDLDYTP